MFKKWICQNRNWVFQNFPFLENDFDALTDYELFCKMVEYAKSLAISNDKFVSELKANLETMYNEGKFDSFIEEIVNLQTTFTFDSVADMKSATNLIDGSFAKTCGFYSFDDKGGAYYKIRTLTTSDVVDNIHLFSLTNSDNLVAELIKGKSINLKQLGATINSDATIILQFAIDNFDEIIIDDFLYVTDTLEINNKLYFKISGMGGISISHEEEKNLINLSNSSNIFISDITLSNDTPRISSDAPLDVYIMYISNSNNIHFNNFNMINSYNKGIDFISCNKIDITNSTFKDGYYDMVTFLTECSNILVDNCVFDTSGCSYANSYLLATGSGDYSTTVDYLIKNLTVTNSKFYNNPQWEGIDCHGGENIIIQNNYVENCKLGIMVGYDNRTPVNNILDDNIVIENNIIINKVLTDTQEGIVVLGEPSKYSNNVTIRNNYIKGYGLVNNDYYSLRVGNGKYVDIIGNNIDGVSNVGIFLVNSYIGNIKENEIYNNTNSQSVGIRLNSGCWLFKINNNIIKGGINNPMYIGVWNSGKGLAMLQDNLALNTGTKYYTSGGNSTIIGTVANDNVNRCGCSGIHTVDKNDIIKSYCTDDLIKSVEATVNDLTLTGTSESNEITTNTTIANYLCIGEEIIITGADTGGNDLTTVIVDIIGNNKMIIKDTIKTSVTDTSVSTTASTWVNA